MAAEGLRLSPELQRLDALIEARERAHLSARRALWSPEGTPRRDRDDGAGQGSRPVNLSDALLERAAEIRNAKGAVEAAEICLRLAAAWADAEAGSVLLVDGDDRLVFWAVQGGAGDVLLGQPVPRGSGLAWAAAEGGVTLFVQDVAVDPRHYAGTDRETGFHTESLLAIPLRTDAHLYGVLELINARNTGGFLPWQIDAVESLAVSLTETLEGEA